jgi:hypothetical protein
MILNIITDLKITLVFLIRRYDLICQSKNEEVTRSWNIFILGNFIICILRHI